MATLSPSRLSDSQDSWLKSLVKWIRSRTMTDWLKILGTVMAAVFVVWNMVQQHEYRLNQIESGFKEHLDKHDDQYREIQKSLRDIDLTLSRITAVHP
jgi:cell division protein ZapA (FtsZ GTPase activity inhibitor)